MAPSVKAAPPGSDDTDSGSRGCSLTRRFHGSIRRLSSASDVNDTTGAVVNVMHGVPLNSDGLALLSPVGSGLKRRSEGTQSENSVTTSMCTTAPAARRGLVSTVTSPRLSHQAIATV